MKATNEPDARERAATDRLRLGRTVIALGMVSLFTDMASEMVYTQIPIFLTGVLGASAASVGVIEGIAESTASLLRLVSGYWSDRSGQRKPLTLLGYSLGAIYKPLLYFVSAWPFVLLLRFMDRLGKGLRSAPRDALITETTPKELRGRAFGLHRAMDTAGAVFGPLLGLLFLSLLPRFGWAADLGHNLRLLFLFAGIPGLLAVATLFFGVREPRPTPSHQNTNDPGSKFKFPRWGDLKPEYRRFLAITFLFNIGNSSDAFLILRAHKLGFSSVELLWLYAAFNVTEVLLGYAAGSLSDRIGRRPLIVAGYMVFAGVYWGLGIANSKAAIWPLFILYGLYYTLTQGVQRAFAADMADPKQRASQIGAYFTVVGVALLPASLIAGRLFEMNQGAPFFVGASTAILSALLLATMPAPVKNQAGDASGRLDSHA